MKVCIKNSRGSHSNQIWALHQAGVETVLDALVIMLSECYSTLHEPWTPAYNWIFQRMLKYLEIKWVMFLFSQNDDLSLSMCTRYCQMKWLPVGIKSWFHKTPPLFHCEHIFAVIYVLSVCLCVSWLTQHGECTNGQSSCSTGCVSLGQADSNGKTSLQGPWW